MPRLVNTMCVNAHTDYTQNVINSRPELSENQMAFAPERLFKARRDKHWTRAHLANLIGVSPDTIKRWERKAGGTKPRGDHIWQAELALDLSPGYLHGGPEKLPAAPGLTVEQEAADAARWRLLSPENRQAMREI